MVTINRNMHVAAHDRVAVAHGAVTAAQICANYYQPGRGELPTPEYVDAIQSLTDAVCEYGDAVAALGGILAWRAESLHRPRSGR
jgi:hypothetical protein